MYTTLWVNFMVNSLPYLLMSGMKWTIYVRQLPSQIHFWPSLITAVKSSAGGHIHTAFRSFLHTSHILNSCMVPTSGPLVVCENECNRHVIPSQLNFVVLLWLDNCILCLTMTECWASFFRLFILTFMHNYLHVWYESRNSTALPPWLLFFTKETWSPLIYAGSGRSLEDFFPFLPQLHLSRDASRQNIKLQEMNMKNTEIMSGGDAIAH